MEFDFNISELEFLRRLLHQNAEISRAEYNTTKILHDYLLSYQPDEIIKPLKGCGLIAKFKGASGGPNIGIRADIDALPIPETIDIDYASNNPGVSHKCGHDGHTVMVMGIAQYLANNPPKNGNVYLIFQSAEETGEGAKRIVKTFKKHSIELDYIFGLHNLPKYELGEVVSTAGVFAAASTGIEVFLKGKTSHAAEPENGNSPALVLSHLIRFITELSTKSTFKSMALATVVHAHLGEIAFGTNPGYAELRATLRANFDLDLNKQIELLTAEIESKSADAGLDFTIGFTESFKSTRNTPETFRLIESAAKENDFTFSEMEKPFKWSEDFGQYKKIANCGFFGLGAGKDMPNLHHETYDFPNALIPYGLKIYLSLIKNFCY